MQRLIVPHGNGSAKRSLIVLFVAALLLLAVGAGARAQQIVTVAIRSAVTQSYFIASLPRKPEAVAFLFPGSGGYVRLRQENEQIKFSPNNFLIRTRSEYVKRGVVAAFLDAPSDMQNDSGMSDEFRLGEQHYSDVAAIIADMRQRLPGLPLFLVGTSRGSTSAAALAARFGEQIAGVVLSSTVFRQSGRQAKEPGPGLSRFDFASIKAPLLFVHHVSDKCPVTPYGDVARLSDKYPLVTVFGGSPPQSGPCDALSQHGFLGKESDTVEQIVNWMLKKPFQHEVK